MLLWMGISWLGLKRRLVGAVRMQDNIYWADHIPTPFVMGILRPKIYLPSEMAPEKLPYVLLHERTHIRRGDHLFRLAASMALCLHWFNPLVWLAFFLSARDMEMSCDERVLRSGGTNIQQNYATALVELAAGQKIHWNIPVAFGEGDTKERVKNVMKYKKLARGATLLCMVLVLLVGTGLAVDPIRERKRMIPFPAYQEGVNQYNSSIYGVEPFSLEMELPEEWQVRVPKQGDPEEIAAMDLTMLGFTPVYLYDGDRLMGVAAYNTFDPAEGEGLPREEYYKAVYSQLRLGSLYHWDAYTPVRSSDVEETAMATVYTVTVPEGASAAQGIQRTAPGILCYNKKMGVYAALQLEPEAVADGEWEHLAKSARLISMAEEKPALEQIRGIVDNLYNRLCRLVAQENKPEETRSFTAFLKKMEGDTLWLDEVEFISEENTQRIQELGLTPDDMPNGYYLHDVSQELIECRFTDETVYTFIDWSRMFTKEGEDWTVTTTDREMFRQYVDSYYNSLPGMPFFFEATGDEVTSLLETPMA